MLTESHEPGRTFGRRDFLRAFVATALIVAGLAFGVIPDLVPSKPPAVGDVAETSIYAPRDATIPNSVATDAKRQAAAKAVEPQYNYTPAGAATLAGNQLDSLMAELGPVDVAMASTTAPAARETLLQQALPSLPSADKDVLRTMDSARWGPVEQAAEQLLVSVEQGQEIRDVSKVPDLILKEMPAGLSIQERQLVTDLVTPLVVPNSVYDQTLTDAARAAAAAAVPVSYDHFKAGQAIVRAHDPITAAEMVDIHYFGLDTSGTQWGAVAAWLALSLLVAVMMLSWLWRYRSEYWQRSRTLILIGLLLAITVLAEKLPAGRAWLPYAVPSATAGMLLTVLLDSATGTVVLVLLAAMAGLANGSSFEFALYVLLPGLAGTLAIHRGERQLYFARAALAVALTAVAVVGVFALLGQHDPTGMLELSAAALASALIATIVTLGSFVILGNLFGILTSSQLLELANPSQPLLRRLLVETPGTYHHSLMVGNLAERAAEAIGADPLLARVAAYYHDVGKLANPLVFIENQQNGENVHDQLEPEDSASILRQHVADGVNLATRARMPKPLIDFIPQHHGTSLMAFFYAKAREEAAAPFGGLDTKGGLAAAETVDPAKFRHSGPKPQSREAAVLMLADGVEASVRSLSSRDEPTIRAMVTQIIGERLADGQLNECELTIRDLDRVREAFVGQLLGMYHQRIAYPQNKVVEIESRRGRNQA